MRGIRRGESLALVALAWSARATSVVSTGLLLLFFVGEGFDPSDVTPRQWAGLLFFPLGVVAGMILAWWREGVGGAVTVGSLLAFYAWHVLAGGWVPRGSAFIAFSLPGFLFLLYGLLSRRMVEPGLATAGR
jgi:hypothetical protein